MWKFNDIGPNWGRMNKMERSLDPETDDPYIKYLLSIHASKPRY